jgi:tetratricopeptide (TPR) repeat protein
MSDALLKLQSAAAAGDPQAQFQLGWLLARQGDVRRASIWYDRAAERAHPGALRELGLLKRFGIDGPAHGEDGIALLRKAAEQDDADALYWLAHWHFSRGDDLDRAMTLLRRAGDAEHGLAQRNLGLMRADAGDAPAARDWLEKAQANGDRHSTRLLAALSSDTTSTRARDAVPAVEVHCGDPRIATCDGVFSALDCTHLIELARPHLKPSRTVSSRDNRVILSDYRSSSAHELQPFQEDPWALTLQRRLCALVDASLDRAETLSLLHYAPGQEYRPHRDYLSPMTLREPDGIRAGQRISTVFAYLCDVEAGGETEFPDLGVKIEPRRGRVVLFRNVLPDGQPDTRTLHAGLPVTQGEKWLGTLWIRERAVRTI